MKVKKRNNKGFSLVELIVVILIMAVLAVAIAPNVMQWVKNAREARDKNNYEQLVSVVQEAMTYSGVFDEVNSPSEVTITMLNGTNTIEAADGRTLTHLTDALDTLLPDWRNVNPTDTTASYWIKIKNGMIEKDPNPTLSFAN